MGEGAKPESRPGCLRALFAVVLGFAALEGGIVLTAVSLHALFGKSPGFTPQAAGLAIVGVLLVFLGPRWLMRIGRSEVKVTWAQAGAALPDFVLAFWFVLGWAAPQVIGGEAARLLVGIMVLEFIIIHASVGLVAFPEQAARRAPDGSMWKSTALAFGGLLLLYGVFAAAISAAFRSWWLFLGFAALLGNKFVFDVLSPRQDAAQRKQQHMARWGTSAFFYLVLAMGSIFIPVPRLGAVSGSRGDGHWETNPEQAVAMGAMYFAILAFFELYGGFRRANVVIQPEEA